MSSVGRDGRAFDILHHQIVRPDIVKMADVGVVQRRDGPGLALEALAELGFGNLDGDDASRRVSRALYTDPIQPAPTGTKIS